jgi:hypothetical protein
MRDRAAQMLANLVGCRLRIASHAADMRGFGFESISETRGPMWFLHLLCCWRIERNGSIFTGSFDWHQPAPGISVQADWDPAYGGSLQEMLLRDWLQDDDLSHKVIIAGRDNLVVDHTDVDDIGTVVVGFTDGHLIRTFPAGTQGEFWCVFEKTDTGPYFAWSVDR